MTKTILITGASSGIGKAAAKLFQEKGWNVIATMRKPHREKELTQLENMVVTKLDVLDVDSINAAINEGIEKFGKIDVLLNNAGYGAFGVLEAAKDEQITRQFNTNVIGLIFVTRAIIPHFRANKEGILINVSSFGGKVGLPLGSLYQGSKFAVEGFSEALHYEMEEIGVRVKIIEPGIIDTKFYGRSMDMFMDTTLTEYMGLVQKYMAASQAGGIRSEPIIVAKAIYEAATDGTDQLRYPVGADAVEYLKNRKELDDATFFAGMKKQLGL